MRIRIVVSCLLKGTLMRYLFAPVVLIVTAFLCPYKRTRQTASPVLLLAIACVLLASGARAQNGCTTPASMSLVYTGQSNVTNINARVSIPSLSSDTTNANCSFFGVPTPTGGGFNFSFTKGQTFTEADVDGSLRNDAGGFALLSVRSFGVGGDSQRITVGLSYDLIYSGDVPGNPPYHTYNSGLRLDCTGPAPGAITESGVSSQSLACTKLGGAGTATMTVVWVPNILSLACPTSTGTLNMPYSSVLAASGGTPPYSSLRIVIGSLPTGLTLNTSGAITGIPTEGGPFLFSGAVSDRVGQTTTRTCSITIPSPLQFNSLLQSAQLPDLNLNRTPAYPQQLLAVGGVKPYRFFSSNMPAGLSLSPEGAVSGVPTGVEIGKFLEFTAQVQDSNVPPALAVRQFSLRFKPKLKIQPSVLHTYQFPGSAFELNQTPYYCEELKLVNAFGGVTWSAPYPDLRLPQGFTLNQPSSWIEASAITVPATLKGSQIFFLDGTDGEGDVATQRISVDIAPPWLPKSTKDIVLLLNEAADQQVRTLNQAILGMLIDKIPGCKIQILPKPEWLVDAVRDKLDFDLCSKLLDLIFHKQSDKVKRIVELAFYGELNNKIHPPAEDLCRSTLWPAQSQAAPIDARQTSKSHAADVLAALESVPPDRSAATISALVDGLPSALAQRRDDYLANQQAFATLVQTIRQIDADMVAAYEAGNIDLAIQKRPELRARLREAASMARAHSALLSRLLAQITPASPSILPFSDAEWSALKARITANQLTASEQLTLQRLGLDPSAWDALRSKIDQLPSSRFVGSYPGKALELVHYAEGANLGALNAKWAALLEEASQLPQDVTRDGKVSCADVTAVRSSLSKYAGQAGFLFWADVNIDGVVDVRDLSAVAQKLPSGTVCP